MTDDEFDFDASRRNLARLRLRIAHLKRALRRTRLRVRRPQSRPRGSRTQTRRPPSLHSVGRFR